MINSTQSWYVTLTSMIVLFTVSIKFTTGEDGFKCIESERQALLSFKHGVIDSNSVLFSWSNDSEDCCSWTGVKCNNLTNHIIELDLHGSFDRYLSGKIGLSLIELSRLRYLDLSSNSFEDAPIPNYVGSFADLEYLNLSNNPFSGNIPSQLGNLSSLHTLDLHGLDNVQGSKSLEWLSHISALQHLDLSVINLENASDWMQVINRLPHLKTLVLSYCHLPSPIFQSYPSVNFSTSLSKLDVSGNQLTSSIFLWMSNFSKTLVFLDFSSSSLQGYIPIIFGNMTSLSYIDFGSNNLEGVSPKSFWNFCDLHSLAVPGNKLKGTFSDFLQILPGCALNSLKYLDFSQNKLSGSLPNFSIFPNLKLLDLSFNEFSGTIPISLGQLSYLETLSLGHNSLEGTILEAHFLKLAKLRSLDLGHNSLSFQPHSHWIPPFQLDVLYFKSCKLGPKFPNWLQWQNLSILDISNASISDMVPHWVWNSFPNLQILDLSKNKLKGKFPTLSRGFTGGTGVINLKSNEFEGQIPLFFSQVTTLNIANNKFSGLTSFLCEINTVSPLSFFDVSNNGFLKELPNCWGNLSNLIFLSLEDNGFSGGIPSSLSDLRILQSLHLANNSFTGEFPSWLQSLNSLVVLDLEGNNLSGPIPAWIGDRLSNLVALSLRFNQFYGQLPPTLCHLQHIHLLDLSSNNITGGIPNCIHNLSALSSSLSDDQYYGIDFLIIGNQLYDNSQQIEEMTMTWKGRDFTMKGYLDFLKSIDFSGNHLTGTIPNEITKLVELVSLNLSRNNLIGEIPEKIGQLKSLDVLDLSRNELVGHIPRSLSQINGLSVLDLSYNKLSGTIPTGTQLQSFNASTYVGNIELCGPPLPICVEEEMFPHSTSMENEGDDNEFATQGFYISLALGFVVGFWGVLGTLIFHRSWRHAYFGFLSDLNDWFYTKTSIYRNKLHMIFKD